MGDAGRELDHLDPASDLAARVRRHLAMLGGDEFADLVAMLVQQLEIFEQDPGAAQRRGRRPAGKGVARGGDHRLDVRLIGEANMARDLPGRRIEDLALARPAAVDPLAADMMTENFHCSLPGRRFNRVEPKHGLSPSPHCPFDRLRRGPG